MQKKLSFNQFALTLAALGSATLTGTSAIASPVSAVETTNSVALDVSELGEDEDADKEDKKKTSKKKDKKKKKGGSEGGCGAGTCG